MTQAQNGDIVKVHYIGKLDDGTVFGTSADQEPLQFTIGEGQLIPDFEQTIVGMSPEETKIVKIPSDKAYGPHHEEMVMEVDRGQFPEDVEPMIDQRLQVRQPDGQTFVVTVTAISENNVTLDGNHPLAGKDLTFEIQLVAIV